MPLVQKKQKMNPGENITAVILAAGRSSRMGMLKPLLPLGRETVIERVIHIFRSAGIPDILVVIGHGAERLTPLLKKKFVRWVINENYDEGMFSSVQAGVKRLHQCSRAFFLHPVDIPLIRISTLQKLMDTFREGKADIYRPCYQGKRGHPPLIAPVLVPYILEFKEPGGLRSLLSRHEERSLDVECDDPGVLKDLNTPEDYEEMQQMNIL